MTPQAEFRVLRRASIALAALAGLAALWGGLARLGWGLSGSNGPEVAWHGALAALGFLGTLIAAERATALGRPWGFAAPLASGVGALALLVLRSSVTGQVLSLTGALGLVAIFVAIYRLQPVLHNAVLGLGAVLWTGGVALWIGGFALYRVAPWWAGLLVVTIAGERLELSRTTGATGGARRSFLASLALFVGGIVLSVASFDLGIRVAGAGLAALALWLARHDLARRTVRAASLTRFMAVCLLSGYMWLGVGGILWLSFGGVIAGAWHDAMLHAVFVGFVMSMVFGHAPVILSAVLGGSIAYRPRFYAHLGLLHASLVIRVVGDLASVPTAVRWGGLLNAVAILLFVVSTAAARPGVKEAPAHV